MPTLPVLAQTFDDGFSSFVASPQGSSTGWSSQLPFWGAEHTLSGNNEAEYYVDSAQTNSPFSDQNGVLTIQATSAASNGVNPLGLAYNSGAISTYKSFSQLYGYFEVRAQLPAGAGLWPAFWLMPTNFKPGPEIDVFEVLGDRPDIVHASVHSISPQSSLEQVILVPDTSTAFHTYGVDWEPQKVTFYMDGTVIGTAATPADMTVPMYMILNLAVGGTGSWPGAPTAQTAFPASLKIDYVYAYQTAGTIGWTDLTPKAPTPLVLPALQAAPVYGNAQAYVNVQHYGNEDGGSPLGGIGVALRNAAGLIVATGVTDLRGFYTFLNLAPGTYSIQYLPPQQYSVRPGNFADPSTGLTSSFTLKSGQNLAVPYQLMTSSAELTGTVQLDGASAASITVKLLDQNGATVSTRLTDATGHFNFWTAAGQYAVEYAPSAGTKLAAGSLADPTTGRTVPIALADGQAFLLVPEQLVSIPAAVTAPAVTAPAVTAPAVTAPVVTAPVVTAPVVTAPAVTAPAVTAPAVTAPAVTAPAVTAPAVTAPAVTAPAVTSPAVTAPVVTAPAVTAPVVTAPVVTTPIVPAPVESAVTPTDPAHTLIGANKTQASPTAIPRMADDAGMTFRFFDSVHGTQFMTSSISEKEGLLTTRPDLVYEGTGMGTVQTDPNNGNVASVYRFFSKIDGTHFFTTSATERDATIATRTDLTFEGSSFNEHLTAQASDVAVYRFFNETNGSHFFTSSNTEQVGISATRSDMVNEGVAFYAPRT